MANVGGQRQYIQFLEGGVVGLAARDGRFLWRYTSPANRTANISTPIYRDNMVFAASGYRTGGGLARLQPRGGEFSATRCRTSAMLSRWPVRWAVTLPRIG